LHDTIMPIDRIRKKPTVLLLNSTLHIGGAENVIALLCRSLDRDLCNVLVGHLKENGVVGEGLQREGYEVVGIKRSRYRLANYFSFLRLRRLLKARRIDVVHTHDLHSLIDASLCRLLMPRLRTVHTFHFGNYPHRSRRYLLLERSFWRLPDCLVAVSRVQRRSIQDTFAIPDHRIEAIWNGVVPVAPADPSPLFTKYVRPGRIVLGSISTLIPQKGITHLLDVAAQLKARGLDFVLLIAGEGLLRTELEQKCRELQLQEHVVFFGWVNDAQTTLLPLVDIFVQSSLWEAMSMVLLEAMSMGKAAVTTRVGENPLIVEEGVTGYVVEPRDVGGMTAALERLMRDAGLRSSFGAAAKARCAQWFSATSMARNYEALYDVMLGQGTGAGPTNSAGLSITPGTNPGD
jgi:glycosyltransferase involved in cell wall biosynthesis